MLKLGLGEGHVSSKNEQKLNSYVIVKFNKSSSLKLKGSAKLTSYKS